MRILLIMVLMGLSFFVQAQDEQAGDTLKTLMLGELTVVGVNNDADTLQSFFRSSGGTSTEGLLSRLGGVGLIRRGAFGQEPMLRGFSNGQVNVVLEGMKMYGACADRMDPVTIYVEPVNLASIEATHGLSGAEFGSTFGGSVNMRMASPVVHGRKTSGLAGFDLHSVSDGLNVFSALNISKEKHAYRGSVTWRKHANYRNGDGAVVDYSQYEKLNLSLSGKFSLGRFDTLQADALLDKGSNIGYPALPMDVNKATAQIYSLSFSRYAPWKFLNSLRSRVYYNSVSHEMSDEHRTGLAMKMIMPGISETAGLSLEGDVHVFHQHRTLVKTDLFSNTMRNEMVMYPAEGTAMRVHTLPFTNRANASLYVEQHLKVKSSKFTFFARADVVTDRLVGNESKVQWQSMGVEGAAVTELAKTVGAMVKRRIGGALLLKGEAGIGQRVPALAERYSFYLYNRFDNYDYLGNPSLEKETAYNADIEISWVKSNLEVSLSPYYRHVRNYIGASVVEGAAAMTDNAAGVKSYENNVYGSFAGLDVSVLARPLDQLLSVTTVKYLRAVDEEGMPLPMVPAAKVVSSLKWGVGSFTVQPEVEFSFAQRNPSIEFGERPTKEYVIVNLRSGYKWKEGWSMTAGLENLLDSSYREHLDFGNVLRPGRNMYLSVTYKF